MTTPTHEGSHPDPDTPTAWPVVASSGRPPRARGQVIGYRGAHARVQRLKGPASAQVCFLCLGPASDWTYLGPVPAPYTSPTGAPYSLDPDDYVPRCRRCHKIGDAYPRATHCGRGHTWDAATTYLRPSDGRRACRACRTEYMREYRRAQGAQPAQVSTEPGNVTLSRASRDPDG